MNEGTIHLDLSTEDKSNDFIKVLETEIIDEKFNLLEFITKYKGEIL